MREFEAQIPLSSPSSGEPSKTLQEVMTNMTELSRDRIRQALSIDEQRIVEKNPEVKEKALKSILSIVEEQQQVYLGSPDPAEWPSGTTESIAARIFQSIYSLGPVDDLLEMDDVEDIAINGPSEIYFRDSAGWHPADRVMVDQLTGDPKSELLRYNTAIREQGKAAGPQNPIVDAWVTEHKHRLSLISQPVTEIYPAAVIRKHRDVSFTIEDFTSIPQKERQSFASQAKLRDLTDIWDRDAIFTPTAAAFFELAVLAGLNILVLGRTGVGKTAFLSMLGSMIPQDRRVLVIEDTRELKIRMGKTPKNCIYLTTQEAQAEGGLDMPMHTLIKSALRQRPDHLILGEARGAEMWDLLNAMQTGHDGNLTSIHAISAEEVVKRVEYMIMLPPANILLPREQISSLISSTFHLVVTYLMPSNGRRYIAEVCALTGGIEKQESGWAPQLENVFLGGEERDYILKLQTKSTRLEPFFNRVGHSFAEIVALEEKTKQRLRETQKGVPANA